MPFKQIIEKIPYRRFMIITPSQADTLIIALWIAVILFGFILGTSRTTKIMLTIPAAAFVANSLGNVFERIFLSSPSFVQGLKLVNLTGDNDTLILFKVMMFALIAVLLTTKGAFEVSLIKPQKTTMSTGINTLFGFFTGGVIVTVVVVFLGGLTFSPLAPTSGSFSTLYNESTLVKLMFDYQDLWLSAPFIALIFWSFFASGFEE